MKKLMDLVFAGLLSAFIGVVAAACPCSGLGCVAQKCPGGIGHAVNCQDCVDTRCTMALCGSSTCADSCTKAAYTACDSGCSS
jgi:hypothetical protein